MRNAHYLPPTDDEQFEEWAESVRDGCTNLDDAGHVCLTCDSCQDLAGRIIDQALDGDSTCDSALRYVSGKQWNAVSRRLYEKIGGLQSRIDDMTSVVEAAGTWFDAPYGDPEDAISRLENAVRVYRHKNEGKLS